MQLYLKPMNIAQLDLVVDLIRQAMNEDEASWARQTLAFHFSCLENNIDSARQLFVYTAEGEDIVGVVGLHNYRWGPAENVWLSWFAVHPAYQGRGFARAMLQAIESHALQQGYAKLFIETYANPVFAKALGFYQYMGFVPVGQIENYLSDGSQMRILCKLLTDSA